MLKLIKQEANLTLTENGAVTNAGSDALLLTQIAMRNDISLPKERYEQARKDLLLAIPSGSFAEGQLAYVLEHYLYGKAS